MTQSHPSPMRPFFQAVLLVLSAAVMCASAWRLGHLPAAPPVGAAGCTNACPRADCACPPRV